MTTVEVSGASSSGRRWPQVSRNAGLIGALGLAAALRLGYSIASNPTRSGPDAPAYENGARGLLDLGFFSDRVPSLPSWPVGYPAFVSSFLALPGDGLRIAMVAQILIVVTGLWRTFTLVEREFNRALAFTVLIAMSLSPALVAASAELMYETLLGALLVIGVDLLSLAARRSTADRVTLIMVAAAALVLTLAATLQTKVLLVGVAVLIWAAVRRRSWIVLVLGVAVLALGPLAMSARNQYVYGHFQTDTKAGETWSYGIGPIDPSATCATSADPFVANRELLACTARWNVDHPAAAAEAVIQRFRTFWTPFVGPARRGTWFHAFDPRRALPGSVRANATFSRVDRVASDGWTLASSLFALLGFVLAVRQRSTRRVAILFALPLLSVLVVSLFSYSDGRFRLPVAAYYTSFQALALLELIRRLRRPRGRGLATP